MLVKSTGLGVVLAVVAASLVACGQGQQPTDAVSTGSISSQPDASGTRQPDASSTRQPDASSTRQPDASNASVASASATLTVQPATVDGCKPNQPIVATVSWNSNSPKVKVMVSGPGQAVPGLFAESGYTGSAKTDNWVIANTKFELLDEASGHVLAQRIVTATPCE